MNPDTDPTTAPDADRAATAPATEGARPTAPERGLALYLHVLRTPGMPVWSAAVLCQRLPIAMSPLALVYVGREATGSFATGALLAGVFAFAEALAAGPMGRRFDRRPAGSELRLVLAVQSVALLLLGLPTVLAGAALPVWALVLLAGLAGGVASGAHGGLRALLVRSVDEEVHQTALSLEATVTTALWAVGPALVAGIAVATGDTWPIVAIGVIAAAGVVVAGALRDPGPGSTEHGVISLVAIWRLGWPAFFQEAAVLLIVGAAYTGLPPLLESLGSNPDLAGPTLAVFAVAGVLGGLAYGSGTWPGRYPTQSVVLILVVTGLIGVAALAPTTLLVLVFVVLAGLAGTPALTARAAAMQEALPEPSWATGFSGLYAAGGVGFGVAGLVTAFLLDVSDARWALVVCVVIAVVATAVSGVVEARRPAPEKAERDA